MLINYTELYSDYDKQIDPILLTELNENRSE